jgi:hypothetical protein
MIQKYSLRRGFDSDFTKKCGNYYNQPIFVKGVKATYFVVYKNELVRNLFLKQYNSKLPTHSIIFCSENKNTFVDKKKENTIALLYFGFPVGNKANNFSRQLY